MARRSMPVVAGVSAWLLIAGCGGGEDDASNVESATTSIVRLHVNRGPEPNAPC